MFQSKFRDRWDDNREGKPPPMTVSVVNQTGIFIDILRILRHKRLT